MTSVRDRHLSISVWLLAATGIYVAALCIAYVADAGDPRAPAPEFLLPSLIAGVLISRTWALVLPVAFLVAVEILPLGWNGDVAEDAAASAMIVGVVTGAILRRGWEHFVVPPPRTSDGFVEAPAHRRRALSELGRRVVSRRAIDGAIDLLRLRLDTFPRGLYQPVATLPIRAATRGRGSESRWGAMLPVLRRLGVEDAVDIGSNVGYFPIQLGSSGIRTLAIESEPPTFRTGLLAVRRSGLKNVGVVALELEPDNVALVPSADCVLCLSIWHHFVRAHGFEEAGVMLAAIWERTRKVMFFDTGENEMPPSFGLPDMGPDPRAWLTSYLGRICAGSNVENLGSHEAFDASGKRCRRNLFAVVRP